MISGDRYVDCSNEGLLKILRGCQPGSPDWIGASGELQRRSLASFADAADRTEKYTRHLALLTWALVFLTVLIAGLTIDLAIVAHRTQPDLQNKHSSDEQAGAAV